jgi:hypothetical protein
MGVIHDVYRESLLTFVDSSGPNRCSEIVLCARSCVSCALAAAQTVVLRPTCSSTAKYDERDDNSSSLLLALFIAIAVMLPDDEIDDVNAESL